MKMLNTNEFKVAGSVVSDAVRAMDLFITSQIARNSGELTVEFLDDLEFSALDRAQTIISLAM